MPEPSPPLPNRIAELDALRGIMAFAVMLYHFTSGLSANLPSVPVSNLDFYVGQFGVQGFFAISGFVILMTLERTRSVGDFIVSRLSRLFPAYWIGLIITTCIVAAAGPAVMHRSVETILLNLTMMQSWFGYVDVDPSYWSLGIELGFYVIMLGLRQLKLLGKVEWIASGFVALRLVARLNPALDAWLDGLTALYHMPFFVVGILAYRMWTGARSFGQQLPIFLLAGLNLYLSNMLELTTAFAVVVMGSVLLADAKLAWLSRPSLLWLGAISYPLYLVHQYLGCTMMLWLGKTGLSGNVSTLLTIAVVIGVAALIHLGVEKPALRAIRKRWIQSKSAKMSVEHDPKKATALR